MGVPYRCWFAGGRAACSHGDSYLPAVAAVSEVLLSIRDKKLLRRLAKGLPDRTIAAQLGGRADQVRKQRARLMAKLQIRSDAELVQAAAQFAPWPVPKPSAAG